MKKLMSVLLLALLVPAAINAPAQACRLHFGPPPTFRMDALESKIVVFGSMENARKNQNGEGGTTDFHITNVVKNDPAFAGKNMVQVPVYVPYKDPNQPRQMLVFGNVVNGEPDFFRGVDCTPAAADYLKGMLAINAKDRVKQLRYCFDYLEHADAEIAKDAFNEFAHAAYTELSQAAKTLSAEKLRQWLQCEKTPPERFALYALLLGHCGTEKDAALLRSLCENQKRTGLYPRFTDGFLTGYILLQPEEGWAYLCKAARPSPGDFAARYACFTTARFFYTSRPNVISRKKIVAFYNDLLDQADMADFPLEELRKAKDWSLTDRILSLWGKPSHKALIIQHSIVRYAVQCPQPQAAKLIAELRKTDPDLIADIEESLQFEAEAAAQTAGANPSNP